MLATFKASVLTMILMAWTTLVLAQTPPAGTTTPGATPPAGGATSPSGTTTSANPGGATGEGLNWIWIILAVAVIAGLLFYFFGRRRSGGTRY